MSSSWLSQTLVCALMNHVAPWLNLFNQTARWGLLECIRVKLPSKYTILSGMKWELVRSCRCMCSASAAAGGSTCGAQLAVWHADAPRVKPPAAAEALTEVHLSSRVRVGSGFLPQKHTYNTVVWHCCVCCRWSFRSNAFNKVSEILHDWKTQQTWHRVTFVLYYTLTWLSHGIWTLSEIRW
jgi:hypothetical protein